MTTQEQIEAKIFLNVADVKNIVAQWKNEHQKVVFTNGCFDLLHAGHLDYLCKAADLGQRLIIGINADVSVKKLKGPQRPILHEKTRAFKLAAMQFVDAVVVFEEDTPYTLISEILPDILTKGGDYQIENIVGAKEVQANGGQVIVLPFLEGHSTTKIISRF